MIANGKENKVHLVLCGGGVRVISTIGAIQVLEEEGIAVASISGISAGSLLGAVICSGMTASELAHWIVGNNLMDHAGERKFSFGKRLAFLHTLRWPFSQYSDSGFPKLYQKLANGDPTFSELNIPFMTASLDIISNRYEIYSNLQSPTMKVSEALRITTSVPTWYPPVESEEKILVDAAIATRNPVWLTAEIDDQLPILILNPIRPDAEKPQDLPEFITTLFGASMASHDHYILSQIITRVPRIQSVDIDCGGISWHSFDISERNRKFLLSQGSTAMRQRLEELSRNLSHVEHTPRSPRQTSHEPGQYSAEHAIAKLMEEIPSTPFGTYKAFVSSTFQDLKEHRSYVISALQRAGIFVDPMEFWSSDNDEPKAISTARLEGCQLCILLVGLRRGFVPDGEDKSITQMEYEAALKTNGMDILIYLLDEDAPWPHKYDELIKDPEVRNWRQSLKDKHTVSSFGLEPSSIDIASGISRWLSKKLKKVHEIAKEQKI